jgi:hypothetical protein
MGGLSITLQTVAKCRVVYGFGGGKRIQHIRALQLSLPWVVVKLAGGYHIEQEWDGRIPPYCSRNAHADPVPMNNCTAAQSRTFYRRLSWTTAEHSRNGLLRLSAVVILRSHQRAAGPLMPVRTGHAAVYVSEISTSSSQFITYQVWSGTVSGRGSRPGETGCGWVKEDGAETIRYHPSTRNVNFRFPMFCGRATHRHGLILL